MAEASTTKPRLSTYHSFAIWRFLAALIIMTYHYVYNTQNGATRALWLEHMLPLLDMFFMMSGFLIYENYAAKIRDAGSYGSFMLKRLARLYPVHLITLLFFIAVAIVSPNGGTGQYVWANLPANVLLLQAWGVNETLSFNYVSWSLSAEFFCYLLMPLVIVVGARLGILGLLALSAVSYLGTHYAINHGWADGEVVAQTKTWGAYRALGSFAIGAAAVQVMNLRPRPIRSHLWGWVIMISSIFAMFAEWNFYLIIALMAVGIVLAASAEKDNPKGMIWSRPIMPVMAVSFGIYMWHPVVDTVMVSVIWKRFLIDYVDFPIAYYPVFCGFLSIVVALVSHKFVEQPIGNLIIGRFTQWQKSKMQTSVSIAGE